MSHVLTRLTSSTRFLPSTSFMRVKYGGQGRERGDAYAGRACAGDKGKERKSLSGDGDKGNPPVCGGHAPLGGPP